jgi:hypothetical protein
VDNKLYDLSQSIQKGLDKLDPAINIAERLQGMTTPGSGIPELALGITGDAIDKLGEITNDAASKLGANPYLAATAGIIAANAPYYMAPYPEGNLGKVGGRAMQGLTDIADEIGGTVLANSMKQNLPDFITRVTTKQSQ